MLWPHESVCRKSTVSQAYLLRTCARVHCCNDVQEISNGDNELVTSKIVQQTYLNAHVCRGPQPCPHVDIHTAKNRLMSLNHGSSTSSTIPGETSQSRRFVFDNHSSGLRLSALLWVGPRCLNRRIFIRRFGHRVHSKTADNPGTETNATSVDDRYNGEGVNRVYVV